MSGEYCVRFSSLNISSTSATAATTTTTTTTTTVEKSRRRGLGADAPTGNEIPKILHSDGWISESAVFAC